MSSSTSSGFGEELLRRKAFIIHPWHSELKLPSSGKLTANLLALRIERSDYTKVPDVVRFVCVLALRRGGRAQRSTQHKIRCTDT